MKELSKKLMAVVMRNGIEIWLEDEKIQNLKSVLRSLSGQGKFIEIDGEVINTADLTGVFTPQTMEDMTHRKNGRYKCKFGVYHERSDICGCWEIERYNKK